MYHAAGLTEQTLETFQGVQLEDLYDLERLFKKNIFVYVMGRVKVEEDDDDGEEEIMVKLVYGSVDTHEETLYLNLYETYFSYISDMKKYSDSYQCSRCVKFWKTGFQLNRHEKTCEGNVVHKFPGGVYRPAAFVFEQLEDQGIEVPERLKYYPYWATYDIKAILVSQRISLSR